jgi:hypothetical protein
VTHSGNGIGIGPPMELGHSGTPFTGPHASDGKRFLMIRWDPAPTGEPIQVVRNWPALLAKPAR